MVSFPIRLQNAKSFWKPGGWKFDLLQFGWFSLFQDPFFEGIMNLQRKMPDLACMTIYGNTIKPTSVIYGLEQFFNVNSMVMSILQ